MASVTYRVYSEKSTASPSADFSLILSQISSIRMSIVFSNFFTAFIEHYRFGQSLSGV